MTPENQKKRSELVKMALAAQAKGDTDEYTRLMMLVPILPEEARAAKQAFGAEWLRNSGFNLSAVEEAYGKDWLLQ